MAEDALSQVVWVTKNANNTVQYYHTERDCRRFPPNPSEITESEAHKRKLSKCKFCADEVDFTNSNRTKPLRDIVE